MEFKVFNDEIDMPLRVTNISGWLWLAGGAVLLLSLVLWMFFGKIDQNLTTCAVYQESEWVCFVDPEQAQNITGAQDAEIEAIGDMPVSYQEAAEALGSSYYADRAGLSMWNIPVTLEFSGEAKDGDTRDVLITLDTVRPFNLLLN